MESTNIYEILIAIEGGIEPTGDQKIDDMHLGDIEGWEELFMNMLSDFITCANTNLRHNGSAKRISEKCRGILLETQSIIESNSEGWKDEYDPDNLF